MLYKLLSDVMGVNSSRKTQLLITNQLFNYRLMQSKSIDGRMFFRQLVTIIVIAIVIIWASVIIQIYYIMSALRQLW